MTRIDSVPWIVREIENAARFVIPSQDSRPCPLGPHRDPPQRGRDGQPRTERCGKDRTGLWTFPCLAHSFYCAPHAFERRRCRLVGDGGTWQAVARIAILRHEGGAFLAESEMRLDEQATGELDGPGTVSTQQVSWRVDHDFVSLEKKALNFPSDTWARDLTVPTGTPSARDVSANVSPYPYIRSITRRCSVLSVPRACPMLSRASGWIPGVSAPDSGQGMLGASAMCAKRRQ